MLNTNAHANVRDYEYSYVTSGTLLAVILERIIGSWWNLLHNSCIFMPAFRFSIFRDPHRFHSLHALRNYSHVPGARSIWITWIFIAIFATYVAELNACRKECSKLYERLQMDQYGYLRNRNIRTRLSFHHDNLSGLNEWYSGRNVYWREEFWKTKPFIDFPI